MDRDIQIADLTKEIENLAEESRRILEIYT